MFQGYLKEVAWVFQCRFKGVLRVLQGSFNSVSRKLQGHLKKLPRVFHGSFQCVSRVFERSSKGIPGKGQICFKGVSSKIKWCSKVFFSGAQGYLKEVQREVLNVYQWLMFQGFFKEVLGCFKEVPRDFQRSLKGVSLKLEFNSASKWCKCW